MQKLGPLVVALASVWTLACDPTVELPDGGLNLSLDRGVDPPPPAPQVDSTPALTPYDVFTVKGSAEGRRVLISGTGQDDTGGTQNLNPQVKTLGAGQFCFDLKLPAPGVYTFQLRAYGEENQVGDPLMNPIQVRYDPDAPQLLDLKTCEGVSAAGCSGHVEICDDDEDNDCNGLTDELDPVCRTCDDDPLEPNDSVDAARLLPGVYDDLQICPGNPDYYGIYVRAGERLEVMARFTHAEGDLNLRLFAVDGTTVLLEAVTQDDDEAFTYTATVTGVYALMVYGSEATTNSYQLSLLIQSN
ncbi:MAG: PPC domain-containing protein [Myxococcales bacterium]|nr:PPC domain-containing protein [Myxococcales bacterium]